MKESTQRPNIEDFNYDDSTVEAHGYFLHHLPPSISGREVEHIPAGSWQYELLKQKLTGKVQDETKPNSNPPSQTPNP